MTEPRAPASVLARSYSVGVDPDGSVTLTLADEPLDGVSIVDGKLVGAEVVVDTHAVLVGLDPDGDLVGRPVTPLALRDGSLCFDPSQGGIRAREICRFSVWRSRNGRSFSGKISRSC